MLAYMFRFDAKKGYYFYPETENEDDVQRWMNKGSAYENNVEPRDDVCVIKHGLKIPVDAEDYESFCMRIKAEEGALCGGAGVIIKEQ